MSALMQNDGRLRFRAHRPKDGNRRKQERTLSGVVALHYITRNRLKMGMSWAQANAWTEALR